MVSRKLLGKMKRLLGLSNTPTIKSWGYYINGPKPEFIKKSEYDLIVTDSDDHNGNAFTRDVVEDMKMSPSGKKKILISYISLGEAENYRSYWQKSWNKTRPVWLGKENPDWPGNFSVKQWWNPIWWKVTKEILDKVMSAGFDGVYIDKIDVYNDLGGSEELQKKMVDYIIKVSKYVKEKNPDFMVIAQNAEELAEYPEYLIAVDGIGRENVIYDNDGVKNSVSEYNDAVQYLDMFVTSKKLVLVVEYVKAAKKTYTLNKLAGKSYVCYFGPLSLDKLV